MDMSMIDDRCQQDTCTTAHGSCLGALVALRGKGLYMSTLSFSMPRIRRFVNHFWSTF
jgi:hypothetical protein